MPELPEVETVVRALRPNLEQRRLTEVRNYWPRHIDRPSLPELQRRIHGRVITKLSRRGKYILIHLDDGQTLIIHLRMSGHLAVVDAGEPVADHTHTIFALDHGRELRFRDTRKFGRVYLVDDPQEVVGKLGPEPLADTFTAAAFAARLARHKRILKPLLLDQTVVAGIGNIYADEALFEAGIHPTRHSDSLSPEEIARLYTAIRNVLAVGIAREGASINTYVKPDGEKGDMQNAVRVFRRTGAPCTTCGSPIERIIVGQRSTHFCPVCQK